MKAFETIVAGIFYSWFGGAVFVPFLILLSNETAQNVVSIVAMCSMAIMFVVGVKSYRKLLKEKNDSN